MRRGAPPLAALALLGACAIHAPPAARAPTPAAAPAVDPACPPLVVELPSVGEHPGISVPDVPSIEEPTGRVLSPFHEKVAALLRGVAKDHVRIAVYGDSNLTMDFLTGQLRRRLQGRYGDAGHGFVALGQPWSHYRHMDVKHRPGDGFKSYAVSTHPIGDGIYGFSGIAAESLQQGATSYLATADPSAPIGKAASRLDVYYLERTKYGVLEILVDGERVARLNTAAKRDRVARHSVRFPDGPHEIRFVAGSPAPVRLLGAVLERDEPGFVVDSLGVGALTTRAHARESKETNEAMLALRGYDLVIFSGGTNDVVHADKVPGWLREVMDVHRRALPGVPILLLTPPDRGQKESYKPNIEVGRQRRQIALEYGTAFWDLWAAMGGEGSMKRFHELGLSSKYDYTHFSEAGGAWVADRLYLALWRDLRAYLAKHPRAGCPR